MVINDTLKQTQFLHYLFSIVQFIFNTAYSALALAVTPSSAPMTTSNATTLEMMSHAKKHHHFKVFACHA